MNFMQDLSMNTMLAKFMSAVARHLSGVPNQQGIACFSMMCIVATA